MNTKNTKKRFVLSLVVTIVSIAMLVGATFAWFTDSVTSGKNKIIAGNLDVELTHSNGKVTNEDVSGVTNLFNTDLWEPGKVVYENFTVKNVGNLALKYQLKLNVEKSNSYNGHDLTEVLRVVKVDNGFSENERDKAIALFDGTNDMSIDEFCLDSQGWLNAGENSEPIGIIVYWKPTDNDNIYNVNNYTGTCPTSDGEPLFVEFGVELLASQKDFETDSFGNDYDISAATFRQTSVPKRVKPLIIPVVQGTKEVREPESSEETLTRVIKNQNMTVTYTPGTKLTEDTAVAADLKSADSTTGFEFVDENNVIEGLVVEGEKSVARYDMTLNIDQTNTVLNKVTKVIPKYLVNVEVYHNSATPMSKLETEATEPVPLTGEGAKEWYYYNPSTGLLTLWVFHASDVEIVYEQPEIAIYDGSNITDYNALTPIAYESLTSFRDRVNYGETYNEKTALLLKDIDLNPGANEEGHDFGNDGPNNFWFAIGWGHRGTYSHPFEGTFDGNGKTIKNIYQRSYYGANKVFNEPPFGAHGSDNDIPFDTNYYCGDCYCGYVTPTGLFGYINNATIKNFTLDGAYIQSEWLGCDYHNTAAIAGQVFGNTSIENIVVKNTKIIGYNLGASPVVGAVSKDSNIVLKNVKVDCSNKLSATTVNAVDTHCSGLIGTVALDAGSVKLNNCDIAADLGNAPFSYKYGGPNDWYCWRSSGMLIGCFANNTVCNGEAVDATYEAPQADTDGYFKTTFTFSYGTVSKSVDVYCKDVTVTFDKWNERIDYNVEYQGKIIPVNRTVFEQLIGGPGNGVDPRTGARILEIKGVKRVFLPGSEPDKK